MTTPADEDDFTELVDFNPDRVDLVGKGANGIPHFIIAKQAQDSAGLLDPEFIRGLVTKATPEPASKEDDTVTITGSPAAITLMIYQAARRAAAEQVSKAEMSSKSINDLPDSAFAYIEPGGTKDESGRTTPRSKRHFPVHDKAHADNAAARIAQGAKFGDKAKPKVEAAQRKFGEKTAKEAAVAAVSKDALDLDAVTPDDGDLDDGVDGLDPTTPFAAPDNLDDLPGDPTDPGSPAWEGIDAATAQKWLGILARAQNAIGLLADREMLEAATGDPDDACDAFELQDAQCALDYVISQLAVFAAGEQAEADLAAEAMQAVGKAVAGASAPLDVIEGLVAVRKAGRVLSSVNEQRIRQAADVLQQVLASLPQAPEPSGQPVAKEKEGEKMPETKTEADVAKAAPSAEEQARNTGPVSAGATTGLGQPRQSGPDAALPGDGPQAPLPGDAPGRQVVKADADAPKPKMCAVYNAKGQLIGIVDPADITEVAGATGDASSSPVDDGKSDAGAGDGGDGGKQAGPAAAAAGSGGEDLEPQPSADAGTPAQDVSKTADAGTDNDEITVTQDVLRSAVAEVVKEALATQEAAHQEAVTKMAGEQAKEIATLKARLEEVAKQPAMPKVVTNGAVPPAQLRGQDQGAGTQPVDVAKAAQLRDTLYHGTGPEQAGAFTEMQEMAIAKLQQIRKDPSRAVPAS